MNDFIRPALPTPERALIGQLILRAADLIDSTGWFALQKPGGGIFLNADGGARQNTLGCHCALTALGHEADKARLTNYRSEVLKTFADWLVLHHKAVKKDHADFTIANWNDLHETAAPVIATMRECAADLMA